MQGQITSKLLSFVSELGVDTDIIERQFNKKEEFSKPLPRESFNGVNAIGDIDKTGVISVSSTVDFLKKRGLSEKLNSKAEICLGIFFIKLYIILANTYGFPLPDILKFYERPYIFWIVNISLMILAMILSVDIFIDGIETIPKLNINTLAMYTSTCTLLHMLSVVFLPNSIGYLPFSSVQVLILYFAIKSHSADILNVAHMHKLDSMQAETFSVTNSKRGKNGFITKEVDTKKFFQSHNTNEEMTLYVYMAIIGTFAFSIYAGMFDIPKTLYILAAITSVVLPLNLVYILPKKRISKALFREGISIPDFQVLGIFAKNKTVAVTDKDLFPKGSIRIKALKLYGQYNLEDILGLGHLGFSLLDSPTKYAFEEKMAYINTSLTAEMGVNEQSGFTFLYSGKKISIGNTTYVLSMGLTATEGSKARNPMYFIIDNKVVAVLDIDFIGTPNVYDLLELIERENVDIMLSTLDFNIKPDILRRIYDLEKVHYPEFEKRYIIRKARHGNLKPIKIKKYSGYSYVLGVIYGIKLNKIMRTNINIGLVCMMCGVSLVSYLCLNFTPSLLMPHNILILIAVWFLPSVITMLMTYKV